MQQGDQRLGALREPCGRAWGSSEVIKAALGSLELGVPEIGGSNPGVLAVEAQGFLQLLLHRQRLAPALTPSGTPVPEVEGLPHPGMHGNGELAEVLAVVEQLRAQAVGEIQLLEQPPQQFIQAGLGGMVDRVADGLAVYPGLDPVAHAHAAFPFPLAEGLQGLLMGAAHRLHNSRGRRDPEQAVPGQPSGCGRHGEEIVVSPEGGVRLQLCQPPIGVVGIADPGITALKVQVGQDQRPGSGGQEAAQGGGVETDTVAIAGLNPLGYQQIGTGEAPMQPVHVLAGGHVHGPAEVDASLGQGLAQADVEGVALAVSHHHDLEVRVGGSGW